MQALILLKVIYSPVYTGPTTGSGFKFGLRPRSAGGLSYPDRDLDRLHLHGADSRTSSRKVVPGRVNGAYNSQVMIDSFTTM